ncbi:four helix bundle protein [Parabacteroides sp. OttesenSCG-928-G06]|nr:four helix bundle protein [Parabacteroides sp. OttesenSCG-928-G06]
MSTVKNFEDLKTWQMGRELCKEVFRITNYELFSKDYRLKDQIKASSGSIMDNIAEGFERSGNKEFIQFLYIAKGSCGETRSQLYRALDYNYITEKEFFSLRDKTIQISQAIGSFINYLKQSELKGSKYKSDASDNNPNIEH